MKILFYGTRDYDQIFFDRLKPEYPDIEFTFLESNLYKETASLAAGYDGICAFVNADLGAEVIEELRHQGIRLILMRCAGYNNVDLNKTAECGIKVLRVPGYSPEAVAEHAMALVLTANRHTHKAYIKCRESSGLESVSLDRLLAISDLISLHCPLTPETHHMINKKSISRMKDGVILVNTSRGGLICTEDLITGIRDHKFWAVGLDVYEEESDFVYEDMSEYILKTSTVQRLLSFPNVALTSHQGFFTEEALTNIAETTLQNAEAFRTGMELKNEIYL